MKDAEPTKGDSPLYHVCFIVLDEFGIPLSLPVQICEQIFVNQHVSGPLSFVSAGAAENTVSFAKYYSTFLFYGSVINHLASLSYGLTGKRGRDL